MCESILITGSSRGTGRAIPLRAAAAVYDVIVHCRSPRDSAGVDAAEIAAMGRQARVLQFDVADRQACADALSKDIEAHGVYYGVVCNAGVTSDAVFPAMTDAQWDGVLRSNLDAFYNVLHPIVMPM